MSGQQRPVLTRDGVTVMTVVWTPEDARELQRQLAEVSERDRRRG